MAPLSSKNWQTFSRAGKVYLAFCACVNRRFDHSYKATFIGAITALAWLPMTGCQSQSRSFGDDNRIHVGVHYSARVARQSSPDRNLDLVKRDFANIKKMKIDVVLIDEVDGNDVDSIVECADRHDLKLILPDIQAVNRVRGLSLAGASSSRRIKSPAIVGYYLGHVVNGASFAQAQKESARIHAANAKSLTVVRMDASMISEDRIDAFDHVIAHVAGDESTSKPTAGAFQTIRFRSDGRENDATIRSWLLAFHRGLAKGRSGGLIIEGFRTLPGDGVGLVSRDVPLSPERITMVQRIANRAKRWSTVLTGLGQADVKPLEESLASVDVALLAKGHRRCLLIVNPSTRDFARGEVSLPIELNGSAVVRAVAVPADSDATLGDVIRARSDRIVFQVKLAPGDAALYELF